MPKGIYRRTAAHGRAISLAIRGQQQPEGTRLAITKHGETHRDGRRTAEYSAWISMKQRCFNPNRNSYPNYGGRGIQVALEWLNDFPAFLANVGRRPSSRHSIDRINNDGNYEPGNVRWATRKEQNMNTRRNKNGSN